MPAIFLTSTGLTNAKVSEAILAEARDIQQKAVAIITTADDNKEQGEYCQAAFDDFQKLGFRRVDFVDFEIVPDFDFSDYDIIYVSGGNTFRLLKFAKAANFKKTINDLLARGGIYIGVSAGSYIMCPSIEMAGWKHDPDRNYFGLSDFSGFNFVSFLLVVHYIPEYANVIKEYIASAKYPIMILTNDQAFLLKDGQVKFIGEGDEVVL